MVEKEYKTLVSHKQYECIKLMFQWTRCIIQKNYYFDTDEMYCSRNDITVRIRQKKTIIIYRLRLRFVMKVVCI